MTLYEFGKEFQSRYLGRVDVLTIRDAVCSSFVDGVMERAEVFVRLPLRELTKYDVLMIMNLLAEAAERSEEE